MTKDEEIRQLKEEIRRYENAWVPLIEEIYSLRRKLWSKEFANGDTGDGTGNDGLEQTSG